MAKDLLEVLYILVGLYAFATGYKALRDPGHPAPFGSAFFWWTFGVIMVAGPYLSPLVVGLGLILMAILTAARQVRPGTAACPDEQYREKEARRLGGWIFLPALTIGVVAFGVAQLGPMFFSIKPMTAGLLGLGGGGVVATILGLAVTRSAPKNIIEDGSRLLQQVGAATLLPLVLAALGVVFKEAGVGQVISAGISQVIPEGSRLAGVCAYCLGMALFTVVMGNAFAAFLVITAGIGVPFVFNLGAHPALTAALGMTAGYCGTLVTPMAANFNIVPVAILETKSKYRIIISQLPVALVLLVIHIILMYTLAF